MFKVLTAVMIQVEVFWDVTVCSVVVGYQRFRGPCCLHRQGEGGGSVDLCWYPTATLHGVTIQNLSLPGIIKA